MADISRPFLSLRVLVPGLLLIVLLTGIASIYRTALDRAEKEAVEDAVVSLEQRLERMRHTLAFYASIGADEQAQQELAGLPADPVVDVALFVNERDEVVAASRRAAIGRAAAAVVAEMPEFAGIDYARLIERARTRGASEVEYGAGPYVTGATMIELRRPSPVLRPAVLLGSLIIVETTEPRLRQSRDSAQRRATAMAMIVAALAAALGAALHAMVTRPVLRLVNAVSRFAAGDEHARAPLTGAGELVFLARGLNDAICKVVRAQKDVRRLNVELEQRVLERTAQLEAANKELESFSYSVSHDLRAPLRTIDGFSQALFEDYNDKLDDQGRDALMRVRAAASRMGVLIDDLLNLSRVTRAELNVQPVDLGQIAREVVAVLQSTEPERDVEVAIARDLSVQADPRLLRIVLENLLSNAWKFTRRTQGARIEVGAGEGQGRPGYYVRDNGAGFDMAFVEKLFTPFQRLHRPEDFEGTGVGLATVARIVRRHGGEVWAEGEPGKGATFWFSLPRAPAAA